MWLVFHVTRQTGSYLKQYGNNLPYRSCSCTHLRL